MDGSKLEFLKAFIDTVWNDGRIDAIDRFVAQEYYIRHDPGDPWEGQKLTVDGFKDRVTHSRAPFPDQKFTILDHCETANSVIITWSWRATHQGRIAHFPPTGKAIAMTGATIYDFNDGKICGHWQVADRLGVFQQLAALSDNTHAGI